MADFLNNVVNQIPIPKNLSPQDLLGKVEEQKDKFGNLLSSPNRPEIPKPKDALSELKKKLPEDQAKKALDKLKELSQKPKKILQSVKRPANLKTKEIPTPKKFKKAEFEKLKGINGQITNVKGGIQNIKSQAENFKTNLGK